MAESCSSSAGSSFRELDDVFLQTQTRIWLGEVLGGRLDEDLPISDLLQDGEILFEVAEVLWNLLLTKKELRHLKQKFRPFGSKKIGGRYRPYSNIDSFFKICKILGLSGIDLFSPSDVVENKNIRKVCICIRALSKKARSKMLNVPDFNVVRNSVSMSTDMVGVLRRSLESPQCTVSSSSSSTLRKGSLITSKQKKLDSGPTDRDDDSSSDESDEAESRYMGENSLSPVGKLDYGYRVNSDQQNFHEAHSHRNSTGNFNYSLEKDYSVVGDSSCTSVGENNYISEYLAFSDLMVHANNGNGPVIPDGEKNMFDFFLNIDSQESGKRSFQNGPQRKFYDDDDTEVSSTTSMTSVLGRLLNLELFDDQFDEDESLSPNDSIESKENEAEKHSGDSFVSSEQPKIDTFETQPVTVLDSEEAQSKLAPRVLHDSTEHFPSPQTSNTGKSVCLENSDAVTNDNHETLLCEDKGNGNFGAATLGSDSYILQQENHISDIGIYVSDVNSNVLTASCNSKFNESKQLHNVKIERNSNNQGTLPVSYGTKFVEDDARKPLADNYSCLSVNDTNGAREDACASNSIQDSNAAAENSSQDTREHQHIQEKNILEGKKDTSPQTPLGKRRRRRVLGTVVKGTAIAGVLFLLLQIRKSIGNNTQDSKPRAQVSKKNGKLLSRKPQMGGTGKKGMYPTDRIRL